MAINDLKAGLTKEEVKSKYTGKIIFFHSQFSRSFDSITHEYMSKKLNQVEYDNIMESVNLDSVSNRSKELSRLGVDIELK